MRKILISAVLVAAFVIGTTQAASAGGWAVVTVDPMPTPPTAGAPLEVGFTILQHGTTGYSTRNARIIITSPTGERVQFAAEPSGATGHHVAQVTFPAEGVWTWQVLPDWFPIQDLGQITVVGASATREIAAPGSDITPAASVTATREVTEPMSSAIRLLLGAALAAVAALTVAELRGTRRRVAA